MIRFSKYHTKLQKLYAEQNNLLDYYSTLVDKTGCLKCPNYSRENTLFESRYRKCNDCNFLNDLLDVARKMDKINKDIDDFIENEYARVVYLYYQKKKPQLIRINTKEEYSWESAFGNDFEIIEKTLKHSLVGLVEKTGRYKLK